MKKIVLLITSMMFVATAAMAQPQRGPQGPRGFNNHGFHRGPRVAMKVVKLTNDEIAEKFAHRLKLEEDKTAEFASVMTTFLAERAAINEQYQVKTKPMSRQRMPKGKLTEEQKNELKSMYEQMHANAKAMLKLHKDYRPQFLEVLNGRQYHRMMHLLYDQGMFVKFVRITPDKDEKETPTNKEQQVSSRGADGIASSIGAIEKGASDGQWYSIDGVRQNGQPSQTGIFIRNGKKVLVK